MFQPRFYGAARLQRNDALNGIIHFHVSSFEASSGGNRPRVDPEPGVGVCSGDLRAFGTTGAVRTVPSGRPWLHCHALRLGIY